MGSHCGLADGKHSSVGRSENGVPNGPIFRSGSKMVKASKVLKKH